MQQLRGDPDYVVDDNVKEAPAGESQEVEEVGVPLEEPKEMRDRALEVEAMLMERG